jgi:hypothetical protein
VINTLFSFGSPSVLIIWGVENGYVGQTKQIDVPDPYDEYEKIHLDGY